MDVVALDKWLREHKAIAPATMCAELKISAGNFHNYRISGKMPEKMYKAVIEYLKAYGFNVIEVPDGYKSQQKVISVNLSAEDDEEEMIKEVKKQLTPKPTGKKVAAAEPAKEEKSGEQVGKVYKKVHKAIEPDNPREGTVSFFNKHGFATWAEVNAEKSKKKKDGK